LSKQDMPDQFQSEPGLHHPNKK